MRCRYSALTIMVLPVVLAGTHTVQAGANPPRSIPTGIEATPATRIEADQKTGTIRFIVKGQEAARLDDIGLHVRNGVSYGGRINDMDSPAAYDKAFRQQR